MTSALLALNKKRNQSKQAVAEMIKYAINKSYFNISNDELRIKFLKNIIEVTEGKIYVEFEYSISVKRLTEIILQKGDVEEAARLIQDIQIETFGSLDRIYKVEYILFQMRILLSKGDYVRTLIVSNKIIRRHLNEPGLEKMKVEFYTLMIKYYSHENKNFEIALSYKILFDFINELESKSNQSNSGMNVEENYAKELLTTCKKSYYFENYVMYLNICPILKETISAMTELQNNYIKDLDLNTDLKDLISVKLGDNIIAISNNILDKYRRFSLFHDNQQYNVNGDKNFRFFRKYLIQFNLLLCQKYFSQLRIERISRMIFINQDEVENEICDMVSNQYLFARINRIAGIISFRRKKDMDDKLNDLNFDQEKMLETVETTCHLVHKENLKYNIKK